MRRFARWLMGFWLLLALAGHAGAADGPVLVVNFEGPVTPVLVSYIDRAIDAAEARGARALILELDTPGGSVDITKQITQRITASTVPVIVYVAPRGAHAGSAGTFITLSGHLAAMAPGSSIGAASPVGSEGADLPDTLKAKETNILVADIKNLAARRGEAAVAWAERAVSEAAAATADEALTMGVIDAVATDVPDLLVRLDGKQVTVAGEEVVLDLGGAPIEPLAQTPFEAFLNTITNPALAAILLTIGLNAILFELSSPGGYLAGIIGVTCLLLAFFALGMLDANWAGIGFVLVAFILFVIDIKAATHGALTLGGLASFVFGAYLLFNNSGVAVPWGSIIGSSLVTAAFFAFVVTKVIQARRRAPVTGREGLLGASGVVRQALDPDGMVLVQGELWHATGESGPIDVGARVVVTEQSGLRLRVRAL